MNHSMFSMKNHLSRGRNNKMFSFSQHVSSLTQLHQGLIVINDTTHYEERSSPMKMLKNQMIANYASPHVNIVWLVTHINKLHPVMLIGPL